MPKLSKINIIKKIIISQWCMILKKTVVKVFIFTYSNFYSNIGMLHQYDKEPLTLEVDICKKTLNLATNNKILKILNMINYKNFQNFYFWFISN